jgi:hypothetical protein
MPILFADSLASTGLAALRKGLLGRPKMAQDIEMLSEQRWRQTQACSRQPACTASEEAKGRSLGD